MDDSESFTVVEADGDTSLRVFNMDDTFTKLNSASRVDLDIPFTDTLRQKFPKHILVTVPASNLDLLLFAAMGNARAELNTDDDSVFRWRGYVQDPRGGNGMLGDAVFFGRYRYAWSGNEFIIYIMERVQYILYPCGPSETPQSTSTVIDALLLSAGKALGGEIDQFIYVYDNYWTRSRNLWEQVQKAHWDDVILDPKEKEALQEVASNFFDSKEVYDQFGIPWKRGLIFYGPVGNGKTISTKALMHTLYDRKYPKSAVPTLYVKSAPQTYNIREVFQLARNMAPCLLVMEDIETIVTSANRSYFFNEVDGLESNDGILMIASTNYLERLDPGLSKRPSRFDRKYLFPLPGKDQRVQYAEFWRKRLRARSTIKFPPKLCPAIAGITEGFSFAYMQEAFVATLLVIAHDKTDDLAGLVNSKTANPQNVSEEYVVNWIEDRDASLNKDKSGDKDDLNNYKLWRVMQKQVEILRHDMDSSSPNKTITEPAHDAYSQHRQKGRDFPTQVASPTTVRPPNQFVRTSRPVPQSVAYSRDQSTPTTQAPIQYLQRIPFSQTIRPMKAPVPMPIPVEQPIHPGMQPMHQDATPYHHPTPPSPPSPSHGKYQLHTDPTTGNDPCEPAWSHMQLRMRCSRQGLPLPLPLAASAARQLQACHPQLAPQSSSSSSSSSSSTTTVLPVRSTIEHSSPEELDLEAAMAAVAVADGREADGAPEASPDAVLGAGVGKYLNFTPGAFENMPW